MVMRTDRSDGFVGRNFLLRGAAEHGFYTEETDGILLDRVKFFWALDYGHLSFTTDHNVIQNCDGFGAGDAVVYPGASPQTGEFRDRAFYPQQRYNTVVRKCDLHGSTLAYSGSMGNSVRMTENHIYGNTNGISSDTLSAPGHPGLSRRTGCSIDNNLIYSNNLDLYSVEPPPVEPLVPMPIGTGIVWPGMNGGGDAQQLDLRQLAPRHRAGVRPRRARREARGQRRPGGPLRGDRDLRRTSCGNRFFGNVMGRSPAGFKFHSAVDQVRQQARCARDEASLPNGVDFWWDEFAGNNGNCWFDNTGADGSKNSITGSGPGVPPELLPSNCGTSVGHGRSGQGGRRSRTARCTRAETRPAITRSVTGSGCRRSREARRRARSGGRWLAKPGRTCKARAAVRCDSGSMSSQQQRRTSARRGAAAALLLSPGARGVRR